MTAGEIVEDWKAGRITEDRKGDSCNIYCRLCNGYARDDSPDTVWIANSLGKFTMIDWHEKCDAIEKALRSEESKSLLIRLFENAGIAAEDHKRARDVLRGLLERKIV